MHEEPCIDITQAAIVVIKERLKDIPGGPFPYSVVGEPVSIPDADALAASDPYQFQWWALGLVGARPTEEKKGADQGIDGRLYFHDEGPSGKTKQIIFSVKAGNIGPRDVRDLRGVVDRENAEIGVLLSMKEFTQPMRKEAASGGFYHSPYTRDDYPRIQLRTIPEVLAGSGVDYPAILGGNRTFRRAGKPRQKVTPPPHLFPDD